MSSPGQTPKHIKLNEQHHVERPLLDQLAGLGWEANFTRMVFPVLESEGESAVESKGERRAKNGRKIREVLQPHGKTAAMLQKEGRIKHVEPTKGGHWEVREDT